MSTAKLMYRVTTNLVPVNTAVIFTKFYYLHQHNTRFNRNFRIPKFRTKLRSFTLCIIGPKVWNNLDESIKRRWSLASFKSNLKKFLIKKY